MKLHHLITGIDNETLDMGRVLGFIGVLVFCVNSTYVCFLDGKFDAQAWGIAFGAICGGIGVLLNLKKDTEPKPQ